MNVGTQTPRRFYQISQDVLLHTYTQQLNKLEKQFLKRISKEKESTIDSLLKCNSNKIQIGPNGTQLAKKKYMEIDWTCYKKATRDLCYTIFGRDTLGTHTLTGRVGPGAVMYNRKTKQQLPWQQVQDILHHIINKFDVRQLQILDAIRGACRNSARLLNAKLKKRELNLEDEKVVYFIR